MRKVQEQYGRLYHALCPGTKTKAVCIAPNIRYNDNIIDNADDFREMVQKQRFEEAEKTTKRRKCELEREKKRIAELDRIFKRIYEDDISGVISHERFRKLSTGYEAEQKELTEFVKDRASRR